MFCTGSEGEEYPFDAQQRGTHTVKAFLRGGGEVHSGAGGRKCPPGRNRYLPKR